MNQLSQLTQQELDQLFFDRTYIAFVYDRYPPSFDGNVDLGEVVCLYRGHKGERCALGLHIPDAVYDSRMESVNADAVIHKYAGLAFLQPVILLMQSLQSAHDRAAHYKYCPEVVAEGQVDFTQAIETEFRVVAMQFKLTLPPCLEG
jgi:hypothetical protein